MDNVEIYIGLIATAFANGTNENIDAIEAFEDAHPGIGDEAYVAGGPYEYDITNGIVYSV